MPVTGQPPHVRHQHRIRRSHPHEVPAHRLAGCRRHGELRRVIRPDPLVRTHVHYQARPVSTADEEIRRMPHQLPARPGPRQPKRLRGHARHQRIEVQQYQVVALQPRLIAHMPAAGRRPVPAAPVPLTTKSREPTLRPHRLEPDRPQASQGFPLTDAGRADVLRLDVLRRHLAHIHPGLRYDADQPLRPKKRHDRNTYTRPELSRTCLHMTGTQPHTPTEERECLHIAETGQPLGGSGGPRRGVAHFCKQVLAKVSGGGALWRHGIAQRRQSR